VQKNRNYTLCYTYPADLLDYQFNPHIQFKKNKSYEIALVNLETFYSFPNIDDMNKYLLYSPDSGTTWHHLQVPEGSYDITDINVVIQQKN